MFIFGYGLKTLKTTTDTLLVQLCVTNELNGVHCATFHAQTDIFQKIMQIFSHCAV